MQLPDNKCVDLAQQIDRSIKSGDTPTLYAAAEKMLCRQEDFFAAPLIWGAMFKMSARGPEEGTRFAFHVAAKAAELHRQQNSAGFFYSERTKSAMEATLRTAMKCMNSFVEAGMKTDPEAMRTMLADLATRPADKPVQNLVASLLAQSNG